jgi:hypothetical protein
MRHATVSLGTKIVEGAARRTQREFVEFLCVAAGLASKLDAQMEISRITGTGGEGVLQPWQEEVPCGSGSSQHSPGGYTLLGWVKRRGKALTL